MLNAEVQQKHSHNEKLMRELKDYVDKYEVVSYKYQTAEKELQNDKLLISKLEEENKHVKALYDHYKKGFDEIEAEKLTLAKRLDEVTEQYHKNHEELAFYK